MAMGRILRAIVKPEFLEGLFDILYKEDPAQYLYYVLSGGRGWEKAMATKTFITTYKDALIKFSDPAKRDLIKKNIDPFLDYLYVLAITDCDIKKLSEMDLSAVAEILKPEQIQVLRKIAGKT